MTHKEWFNEIVKDVNYLGMSLSKEAWNYQQKEIDKLKKQLLKNEIAAYQDGYEDAVTDFGIWNNGVQTIGCMNTPIKEVIIKMKIETLESEL